MESEFVDMTHKTVSLDSIKFNREKIEGKEKHVLPEAAI